MISFLRPVFYALYGWKKDSFTTSFYRCTCVYGTYSLYIGCTIFVIEKQVILKRYINKLLTETWYYSTDSKIPQQLFPLSDRSRRVRLPPGGGGFVVSSGIITYSNNWFFTRQRPEPRTSYRVASATPKSSCVWHALTSMIGDRVLQRCWGKSEEDERFNPLRSNNNNSRLVVCFMHCLTAYVSNILIFLLCSRVECCFPSLCRRVYVENFGSYYARCDCFILFPF